MRFNPGLRFYLVASHLTLTGILLALLLFATPAMDPPAISINLALLIAALIAGSLIWGAFLANLINRSLWAARARVERLRKGEYQSAGVPSGPSELKDLVGETNRLADTLQAQEKSRQLVLANVTHELARPIGALRLGVDSLQTGALDDAALAEDLLNEMNHTLARMETLVADLAIAARPQSNPIPIEKKCIPLESLLHGLRSRFWRRAENRGVDLQLAISPDLPPILADETRLNQMVANLVDNALKYTPSGGTAIIITSIEDDQIKITVRDTGPGVPPGDLQRVTEPFYQGQNVRGINQGMGLGLSIVSQLAQAHGGRLELLNLPEGGFSASIYLSTCQ